MIINNILDYANYLGIDVKDLEKAIYKGTSCGAWINWDDKKINIGSIVEGSDAEFDRTFYFPVDVKVIDDWFEELETLTEEAWLEANDDEYDEEGDECHIDFF